MMVSQPVILGIKDTSRIQDQIFITVRHFLVCWCGVPPLTRSWICNLLLLLTISRAVILRSKSCLSQDDIFLPPICDSPNPDSQVHVFISPSTRCPFCHLLWLAELQWRYSYPPPHRDVYIHFHREMFTVWWGQHRQHCIA